MDKPNWRFPPPTIHTDNITALVVDKKGDELHKSMKQSEIYAYSPEIITNSGFMVMPKDRWRQYEPGMWFTCNRIYSQSKSGEIQEREMVNIAYLPPNVCRDLNLPISTFINGEVYINCEFVLCPSFIRYPERRNADGRFLKLILLGMGLGFMPAKKFGSSIKGGIVYSGIFAFRGTDYGAMNFAPHAEKDATGHPLERDAFWELTDIIDLKSCLECDIDRPVPHLRISEYPRMSNYLDSLKKLAKWNEIYEEKNRITNKVVKRIEDSLLVPSSAKNLSHLSTSVGAWCDSSETDNWFDVTPTTRKSQTLGPKGIAHSNSSACTTSRSIIKEMRDSPERLNNIQYGRFENSTRRHVGQYGYSMDREMPESQLSLQRQISEVSINDTFFNTTNDDTVTENMSSIRVFDDMHSDHFANSDFDDSIVSPRQDLRNITRELNTTMTSETPMAMSTPKHSPKMGRRKTNVPSCSIPLPPKAKFVRNGAI